MQKFENMDLIAALEAIMHQNTAYYQSDFTYDIKMLREAARSDQPEDKLLLWLSRPSGTFCFRERDVLLKDTQAYNTWKFCGEQTHDRILAYAVELTGAANGTVQGNLYELDYQQHFQHIQDAALPVGANRLIYESALILNQRLLRKSRPPVLFAYQSVSSSVWRPLGGCRYAPDILSNA